MICDYGCGREAKYTFKNGKYCCESWVSYCPKQKEKNKKGQVKRYSLDPKTRKNKIGNCEYCNKEHDGTYASGRFCSKKCARKYSSNIHREMINEKVSATLRNEKYNKEKHIYNLTCLCCENSFQKEIHISSYEQKRFIAICDKCKKTARETDLDNLAFRFWLKFKKQQRTVDEKINKLSWDELPHARKRKKVLEEQNYKCSTCGIEEWNGKLITLSLHHKDGNNKNNSRENLQFLCPNCHTQTETYGIKSLIKRNPSAVGKKQVSDEDLLKYLLESKSIIAGVRKAGITDTRRAKRLLNKYFSLNK